MSTILYEKDMVSLTVWYSPISSEYHFSPIIVVGLGWLGLRRKHKNFIKTLVFHEESCFIGYLNFTNNSTNNCPIFKQTIKPSLYQVSLRYVYYIIRERHGFAVPFLKGVGFLSSEVHTYLYSNRFHSGSREKGKLYPPREKTPEVSSPLTNIPRYSHPVEW